MTLFDLKDNAICNDYKIKFVFCENLMKMITFVTA